MSLSQTREKQERWEKMSNLTLAGDYKGTGTQQWFQGAENAPYFWFIKTAVERHQVTSWLFLGRWGALGVKGGSISADCPVCGPPTSLLQRFRPFYLLCDCPPAIPTGHSPSVWRMKPADFFFTPVGWQASLGRSTAIQPQAEASFALSSCSTPQNREDFWTHWLPWWIRVCVVLRPLWGLLSAEMPRTGDQRDWAGNHSTLCKVNVSVTYKKLPAWSFVWEKKKSYDISPPLLLKGKSNAKNVL